MNFFLIELELILSHERLSKSAMVQGVSIFMNQCPINLLLNTKCLKCGLLIPDWIVLYSFICF